MAVAELINNDNGEKHFSFEVLPPLKGTGTDKLFATIDKLKEFDIEFSDDIKSAMAEITVRPEMLEKGNTLIDIPLLDKALVVMVKRMTLLCRFSSSRP